MARQRSGFSRTSHGSRRRTGWEEGPGGGTVNTFSAPGVAILGIGQSALIDGLTLIRTRGILEIFMITATGAGDGFDGAVGIGVVTLLAFTVGVIAVPAPITEIEWEGWLWHQMFSYHTPTAGSEGDPAAALRIEIDSKAMRKVGSEEVIFACAEVIEAGTAVMEMWLASRLLFKLP